MGEHLLLHGEGAQMWVPYARGLLRKLQAQPGIAKQKVVSLGRQQYIRVRHDGTQGFIEIKARIIDGYEFQTLVENDSMAPTINDCDYFYQIVRFEGNGAGGFGNATAYVPSGALLSPAQTTAQTHPFVISPAGPFAGQALPIVQDVPRDTHYINVDATSRKVTSMMTTTRPTGKRHYTHTFHDILNFGRTAWLGNIMYRTDATLPKVIPATVAVTGGIRLANDIWVMPWSQNREAKFNFRSVPTGDTINLQMTMPSWVTTSPDFEITWVPNNENTRMVAIHHHRETEVINSEDFVYAYQGIVELEFSGTLDGNGNIATYNIVKTREFTPTDSDRFAAVGYDIVDGTNIIAIKLVAYLSDAWHDVAADPMAVSGANRACRSLAIYAEWVTYDGSMVESAPFRTQLLWHGPFMAHTSVPDRQDELGEDYLRWHVDDISAAMEEDFGYAYYEANLNAVDLRADAYAITRFQPDTASNGYAGRWQTEFTAFGDTPIINDSGSPITEPSLNLANFTKYDTAHTMWNDYLVKAGLPGTNPDIAYRSFDWYVAQRILWSGEAWGELGPGNQFREMDFGGFAVHPNESWSVYIPYCFTFFQSTLAPTNADAYPPTSMTMDRIVMKSWDSGTLTATEEYNTTHLDVYNEVRALSPAYAYGDENDIQQLMGSATWGINPEEYRNG